MRDILEKLKGTRRALEINMFILRIIWRNHEFLQLDAALDDM